MFSLFKSNPTKKLRKQYDIKLEQAMQAQRRGDIKSYSMLTAEAESLWSEIQKLEKQLVFTSIHLVLVPDIPGLFAVYWQHNLFVTRPH